VAGGDVVVGAGTSDTDLEFKACDPFSGPLGTLCHSAPLNAQLNPLSRLGEIWDFTAPTVPAAAPPTTLHGQAASTTGGRGQIPAHVADSAPSVGTGSVAAAHAQGDGQPAHTAAPNLPLTPIGMVLGGAALPLLARRVTRHRRYR
jgi:hypothetical protein